MTDKPNILGVIPARAGSKGLPRKNFLPLGGKSLLEIAIGSAGESKMLSRFIVSTEDDELRRIAVDAGAAAPFIRPAELATDEASTWDVMRHAVDWLAEHENWQTDVLVILQPTVPFRRGAHIDATIKRLLESDAPAAITVREVDYPPHWMLEEGEGGKLERLVDDGKTYSRRQDTPPAFQPSGAVYAIRREILDNDPPLPNPGMLGVRMAFEDSINIDQEWQYHLARQLWARNEDQE